MIFKNNIFVLAGGITDKGIVYDFVKKRLDIAIDIYNKKDNTIIFCIGGGTYHKPSILNSNGMVIHESSACAKYLVNNNINESHIIRDWSSYDTIANGYFSFTNYIIPLKLKNITVITSDFHDNRVKLIYNYLNKLFKSNIDIQYLTSKNNIEENVLNERIKREKNSCILFKKNIVDKIHTIEEFVLWLFTKHKSYKAILETNEFKLESNINKTY